MVGPLINERVQRLARYHGQVWNASEFGRSFGVADTTVRRHLDLLSSTFVVRQLLPWKENIRKRQVRSPKVYVKDSGLLHAPLGLRTRSDVESHPKLGASWEGFALEQAIQRLGAQPHECYFWATHAGAELDLLVVRGGRRLGFEFKRTEAPRVTKSMRTAPLGTAGRRRHRFRHHFERQGQRPRSQLHHQRHRWLLMPADHRSSRARSRTQLFRVLDQRHGRLGGEGE